MQAIISILFFCCNYAKYQQTLTLPEVAGCLLSSWGCRGRFEAVLEIWHDVSRPVLRASERAPNGPFVCSQCFETDGRTEQLPADGPSMWQNFLEVSKSSPFTGPVHAAQCEQAPESAKPLVAGRTIAAAAIAGLLKKLLRRFFFYKFGIGFKEQSPTF